MNLGDILRKAVRKTDGLFINTVGRQVRAGDKTFRGMYADGPGPSNDFGIDSPSEVVIITDKDYVIRTLDRPLNVGEIIGLDNNTQHVIVACVVKDHPVLGPGRLHVTCKQYVPSKTSPN